MYIVFAELNGLVIGSIPVMTLGGVKVIGWDSDTYRSAVVGHIKRKNE